MKIDNYLIILILILFIIKFFFLIFKVLYIINNQIISLKIENFLYFYNLLLR